MYNISVYIEKLGSFYNGDLAPIYRFSYIVVIKYHDHGYPMIVAVSSSSSAFHVVVVADLFLF